MAVHAVKDLKKGEEITLSYITPLEPYTIRREVLLKRGFECDCQLCKTDKADKDYARRQRMCLEFNNYVEANKHNPKSILNKGQTFLKQVNFTQKI
jgi:hypothetical protein